MSNLSQDFRQRMERLERNFEVSTVIFRKFEPIFMDMFQNPQGGEPPRQPRSRKHRHDTNTQTFILKLAQTLDFVRLAFFLSCQIQYLSEFSSYDNTHAAGPKAGNTNPHFILSVTFSHCFCVVAAYGEKSKHTV